MAWRGASRLVTARHGGGSAWHGMLWHGRSPLGRLGHGTPGLGVARLPFPGLGEASLGPARPGTVWHGRSCQGAVVRSGRGEAPLWQGTTWPVMAWRVGARQDWLGKAVLGMSRHGVTRQDTARRGFDGR